MQNAIYRKRYLPVIGYTSEKKRSARFHFKMIKRYLLWLFCSILDVTNQLCTHAQTIYCRHNIYLHIIRSRVCILIFWALLIPCRKKIVRTLLTSNYIGMIPKRELFYDWQSNPQALHLGINTIMLYIYIYL